jgi:predicted NBD/HSP70 family sugar kinase
MMMCLKFGTGGRAVGVGKAVPVGEGSGVVVAVAVGRLVGLGIAVIGRLVAGSVEQAANPARSKQHMIIAVLLIN